MSSSSPLQEGDLLAGKYRVEKVLGEGGMGVVVAAHHVALDEKVAIKLLLPDALSNPEAVSRFAREARAAVKIKNEHVARVIDVGSLENGAPYMVMEYLEGSDLGDWLKNQGKLPIEQAVEFVLQACEAIAEAHGAGIVHRDLKPANLFVIKRADGLLSVKVLDFGISKVTAPGSMSDAGYTKTRAIMGSPLYMSPEQMESTRNVDTRTDIWALGVVIYELLTGNLPFLAESMPELITRIIKSEPEPMVTYRPDIPEGLQAVIFKCLEKSRDQRYSNVALLAQALLPFGPKRGRTHVDRITRTILNAGISESSLEVPPSEESIAPPGVSDDTPPPGRGTKASWGRTDGEGPAASNRARAGMFAAGGAVLLVLGAFLFLRTGHSAPTAEPPTAAVAPPPASPPSIATAAPEPAVVVAPANAGTVVPSVAPSAAAAAPPNTVGAAPTKPLMLKVARPPAQKPPPEPAAPPPAKKPPAKASSGHVYDDRE